MCECVHRVCDCAPLRPNTPTLSPRKAVAPLLDGIALPMNLVAPPRKKGPPLAAQGGRPLSFGPAGQWCRAHKRPQGLVPRYPYLLTLRTTCPTPRPHLLLRLGPTSLRPHPRPLRLLQLVHCYEDPMEATVHRAHAYLLNNGSPFFCPGMWPGQDSSARRSLNQMSLRRGTKRDVPVRPHEVPGREFSRGDMLDIRQCHMDDMVTDLVPGSKETPNIAIVMMGQFFPNIVDRTNASPLQKPHFGPTYLF